MWGFHRGKFLIYKGNFEWMKRLLSEIKTENLILDIA